MPSELPPLRYPVANPRLGDREREYVREAVDSSWVSSTGPFIQRFENCFSETFGPGHAVAVSNGTIAIDLALKAVGVGPGDEVIVPNFTFVGSVSPIYRLHAIPVLAPTQEGGWNVDLGAIERLITKKTKAIIAVHLYGVPCDIRGILSLAKRHGLKVIEDAAESLGAKVDGQMVGTFGDVGCFSFFGNKVLTTGEGGMCLAQNQELADLIKLYRDHGMTKEKRYWHQVIGYNGRMTNLQAAVGLGQCESIESIIDERKRIERVYLSHFQETPYFRNLEAHAGPDIETVCWLMSPVLRGGCNFDRDLILEELRKIGIDSRPFFYPCSQMPAFSRFGLGDSRSDDISAHGLNLPTYPILEDDEVSEIALALLGILKNNYRPEGETIWPKLPPKEANAHIDVSIILPTLNEEDNIVDIISSLRQQMVSVSKEYEILVMDDCSEDATVTHVREAFSRDARVKVHVRENARPGLAYSIREGIRLAKGEYLMVMDSDFNHDPEVAGAMSRFAEHYDMVSGSRFTTGGGMQSRLRWWSSLFFNLFVRVLLLLPTQDNLSGYFCIRRRTIQGLDLDFIFQNSGDYFFRLIYGLHCREASILEVPVVYRDKEHGKSKKSFLSTFWLYLTEVLKLKGHDLRG
jgi:perosamine synthetase